MERVGFRESACLKVNFTQRRTGFLIKVCVTGHNLWRLLTTMQPAICVVAETYTDVRGGEGMYRNGYTLGERNNPTTSEDQDVGVGIGQGWRGDGDNEEI